MLLCACVCIGFSGEEATRQQEATVRRPCTSHNHPTHPLPTHTAHAQPPPSTPPPTPHPPPPSEYLDDAAHSRVWPDAFGLDRARLRLKQNASEKVKGFFLPFAMAPSYATVVLRDKEQVRACVCVRVPAVALARACRCARVCVSKGGGVGQGEDARHQRERREVQT